MVHLARVRPTVTRKRRCWVHGCTVAMVAKRSRNKSGQNSNLHSGTRLALNGILMLAQIALWATPKQLYFNPDIPTLLSYRQKTMLLSCSVCTRGCVCVCGSLVQHPFLRALALWFTPRSRCLVRTRAGQFDSPGRNRCGPRARG